MPDFNLAARLLILLVLTSEENHCTADEEKKKRPLLNERFAALAGNRNQRHHIVLNRKKRLLPTATLDTKNTVMEGTGHRKYNDVPNIEERVLSEELAADVGILVTQESTVSGQTHRSDAQNSLHFLNSGKGGGKGRSCAGNCFFDADSYYLDSYEYDVSEDYIPDFDAECSCSPYCIYHATYPFIKPCCDDYCEVCDDPTGVCEFPACSNGVLCGYKVPNGCHCDPFCDPSSEDCCDGFDQCPDDEY